MLLKVCVNFLESIIVKLLDFVSKKKSKIKKDQYKIEATEEKIIFFINKLC